MLLFNVVKSTNSPVVVLPVVAVDIVVVSVVIVVFVLFAVGETVVPICC